MEQTTSRSPLLNTFTIGNRGSLHELLISRYWKYDCPVISMSLSPDDGGGGCFSFISASTGPSALCVWLAVVGFVHGPALCLLDSLLRPIIYIYGRRRYEVYG
ncbi:hypothetical protein IC582_015248 [Cucumis melo]